MLKVIGLFLAIGGATGCGITPSAAPVPVQGTHEEISAFSGEWAGRYSSKATGRHGTIRFALPEHADTGYGEIDMTFSPSARLNRQAASLEYNTKTLDELPPKPCTVVGISVVRIEDDRVRGTMTPYWDPDCECRAHTVFEGKLDGNQITGTFSTRRESSERTLLTGEWRAERRKE